MESPWAPLQLHAYEGFAAAASMPLPSPHANPNRAARCVGLCHGRSTHIVLIQTRVRKVTTDLTEETRPLINRNSWLEESWNELGSCTLLHLVGREWDEYWWLFSKPFFSCQYVHRTSKPCVDSVQIGTPVSHLWKWHQQWDITFFNNVEFCEVSAPSIVKDEYHKLLSTLGLFWICKEKFWTCWLIFYTRVHCWDVSQHICKKLQLLHSSCASKIQDTYSWWCRILWMKS